MWNTSSPRLQVVLQKWAPGNQDQVGPDLLVPQALHALTLKVPLCQKPLEDLKIPPKHKCIQARFLVPSLTLTWCAVKGDP